MRVWQQLHGLIVFIVSDFSSCPNILLSENKVLDNSRFFHHR